MALRFRSDAENRKSGQKSGELLKLRDAALPLRISFPTIKQWIYKKKIRSVLTVGGHHCIHIPNWTGSFSEREAKRRRRAKKSYGASVDVIS